jgi:5-methylcytosine-specific restriction endonuclease McrA
MPLVRACRNRWCPNYQPCPDHPIVAFAGQPPMSPGWASVRAAILERDHWACALCGAPAADVDHIRPRSAGGGDDPGNLRSLCGPCHRAVTGRAGGLASP